MRDDKNFSGKTLADELQENCDVCPRRLRRGTIGAWLNQEQLLCKRDAIRSLGHFTETHLLYVRCFKAD